MDLEKFVSSALVQIVKGVMQAQSDLKDTGAIVNPGTAYLTSSEKAATLTDKYGLLHQVKNVEFDVAVTVSDEQSAAAGAGIKVFGARLGADGKVSYENSTVSRVQFAVPLALPATPSEPEIQKLPDSRRKLNYPPSGGV